VARERTVKREIDGATYEALYKIHQKMVTVTTTLGEKTTQIGGSTPEGIAWIILGELVREGKGTSVT
jgi:hypothetical protein